MKAASLTIAAGHPSAAEAAGEFAAVLYRDVDVLASDIGERNTVRYRNLARAATFIHEGLESAGVPVFRQTYTVSRQHRS